MANKMADSKKLTAEELEKEIARLCDENGYRLTIVGVLRDGTPVAVSNALLDGFGVTATLTKAKQDDAIS